MFCRKCGEYLNKGQLICPTCGAKVDDEEEKEQTPAFTGEFGKKSGLTIRRSEYLLF